jgi:hypothetical protein
MELALESPPAVTQVVRLDSVSKVYGKGEGSVVALDGVGGHTRLSGPDVRLHGH